MLRSRSKMMLFYATKTIKSILGLRKRYSKKYFGEREYLDPLDIPKYRNQLVKPNIYHPLLIKTLKGSKNKDGKSEQEQIYYIDICRFNQQILPDGFPESSVIGCGGLVKAPNRGAIKYTRTYPGGTFEGRRHIPIHVKWRNSTDIPLMIHLNEGEETKADILYGINNRKGNEVYHLYENNQNSATYWYQGQNKHISLIGFYILRKGKENGGYNYHSMDLPLAKYEYPIIIQDCSFYKDGSFESSGDIIVVNGKAWPSLDLERRQYRFYILNGSISRYFNLMLSNDINFTVIGGDKGFLSSPVSQSEVLLAPGEMVDLLIDFSRQPKGTKILLKNNAKTPYPQGDIPNPETTGQIMRFVIPEYDAISISPVKLPDKLRL